jgi:ketosteroid isomerase-like protein
MSQENVEIVRRWQAAMSRGATDATSAVSEFWDTEADYYPTRKFPEAYPCHGVEEIAEFLARFREAWSRLEWAIQELIEVGDDRVLSCVNTRPRVAGAD